MENFWLAFGAVFPMFCYMALGKLIARMGYMEHDDFRKVNGMLFEFFLPCMLFTSIYNSDFKSTANPELIVEVLAFIILLYVGLWLVVPRFFPDRRDAPVVIQGIFRSNYVLFGMLLVSNIYEGRDLGMVAALAAFVVPLYNILAVILFEGFRGGQPGIKLILSKIFHNTLVLSGLLGMFFALTGIKLPAMLVEAIGDIGGVALIMALVCLGGMLSFQSAFSHWRQLLTASVGRLVVVPLVAIIIFALLGYRDLELVTVLAVFASPNAVAAAPMAYVMGGNGDLAGEIVATTAAGSILTIFLFVWVLKSVGLIV